MKANTNDHACRVWSGRQMVADPMIRGRQPTFPAARIMGWTVLEELGDGLRWDEIVGEWRGKVSKSEIAEAIAIFNPVLKRQPFRGFSGGARRGPARSRMPAAA